MLAQTSGDQIINGLKQITDWVTTWAVPLAAIGTVSMAFLQAAKSLFPFRRRFQKTYIREWLLERNETGAEQAEEYLIKLATDGDDEAFYNSPIEDLCGRIKAAVPVILDFPDRYPQLVICLASQADEADTHLLLNPPPLDAFFKRGDESSPREKEQVREFAAAKARVTNQAHCAIDAVQYSIQYRWKYWLQAASFVLSAVLGVIALLFGASRDNPVPTLGAALLIGLLAGFLASVARDLVAAIESWRT